MAAQALSDTKMRVLHEADALLTPALSTNVTSTNSFPPSLHRLISLLLLALVAKLSILMIFHASYSCGLKSTPWTSFKRPMMIALDSVALHPLGVFFDLVLAVVCFSRD